MALFENAKEAVKVWKLKRNRDDDDMGTSSSNNHTPHDYPPDGPWTQPRGSNRTKNSPKGLWHFCKGRKMTHPPAMVKGWVERQADVLTRSSSSCWLNSNEHPSSNTLVSSYATASLSWKARPSACHLHCHYLISRGKPILLHKIEKAGPVTIWVRCIVLLGLNPNPSERTTLFKLTEFQAQCRIPYETVHRTTFIRAHAVSHPGGPNAQTLHVNQCTVHELLVHIILPSPRTGDLFALSSVRTKTETI